MGTVPDALDWVDDPELTWEQVMHRFHALCEAAPVEATITPPGKDWGMGLDVTAYSKLRRLGHACEQCDDDRRDDHEDHVNAFAFAVFPLSFRGIPIIGEREVHGTAFIEGGCYEITDETELHDFRAGSYGGYNRWREELRRRFNPGQSVGEPFFELIYFADNEGCIGPEAAADLLADFEAHPIGDDDPLAPPPLDRFADRYRDWHHACRRRPDRIPLRENR